MAPPGVKVVATNRQARRDFELLDTIEVGIVLEGSEVKSLRESKVQLSDSYARVRDGEMWLQGLHIAPWQSTGSHDRPEPGRTRKLLAHRHEIDRVRSRLDQDRLTLVPLSLYFRNGKAKLELALARAKTKADRRQDIAKRDADAEARRAMGRSLKGERA